MKSGKIVNRARVAIASLALGLVGAIALLGALTVNAGANTWTPLGGPTITGGGAVVAVHPTISGTLYAVVNSPGSEQIFWGQVGKIFKSTDGAATWTAVYTPDVMLQSLALTGTFVYGGGWGHSSASSIYRSHDSGASWQGVYTPTASWNGVYALADRARKESEVWFDFYTGSREYLCHMSFFSTSTNLTVFSQSCSLPHRSPQSRR